MSEIIKIKEKYLSKLNDFLDQNKLNEIKTELFGKNGIISIKFKQLGSIPEENGSTPLQAVFLWFQGCWKNNNPRKGVW